ncbi:Serine/threonine protein kinase [Microbacterium hydrothermale]|uniref:serine/threonine-protein kinase n=1 Tax=Microbacterium hydrothermale TaxID=857427 RepID=UPI0022260E43|nr:serine/threonine-protein kinase [Microbacterium hydrothermale]MCW2163456.1 Serine/threonine protein kinase [Microbacterium hydrothermale]
MPQRLPSSPPILPGLAYIRPLGSGGFADVFLYGQDMPRRDVAVKVLPSDVRDTDLLRMFNAEADVLAHLSAHPSIVTVYQAGISADGRPYIVMEFCPGSLAQRYRVERIPVAEVLSIGVRMAGALESAHHAGLIHRDVKPSNILVTTFGAPVLADFGISSSLVRQGADEMLAMSVPWSAPEVVAEQTAGTVASEVWSLGATVYSLLAGHSPFERREKGQNSREQLRRRIARASYTPITRDDVPASVQEVLEKAMARDPAQRYASARAFGEALQGVQADMGTAATPLEVPAAEWAPAARAIDFADGTVRGPARSRVEREISRKTRDSSGITGYARDEDTDIATPVSTASRALPWVLASATLVTAGAVVVAALYATGVLR